MRRFIFTCALLSLTALDVGCVHRNGHGQSSQGPQALASTGHFELDLEHLLVLPADHPKRVATATWLTGKVVERAQAALTRGDLVGATAWLERLGEIYPGATARTISPHPPAATLARAYYQKAARRGDAQRATLGLSLLATFGSAADRGDVEKEWKTLKEWFALSGDFAEDARPTDDIQRTLEICSTVLPSPWALQQLDRYYQLEQIELVRAMDGGSRERLAQRATANAYLRLRGKLRGGDMQGAIATLSEFEQRFGPSLTVRLLPLREPLRRTTDPKQAARAYLDLIEAFTPQEGDRVAPWLAHQSWQIVAILAQHVLDREPNAALAHLALARAHARRDHPTVAMVHYEQVVDGTEDIGVWHELAAVYHDALQRHVSTANGLAQVQPLLTKIEAFYARANKAWPGEPLVPGWAQTQATLAHAYYDFGQPQAATKAAQTSLRLQVDPEMLTLLGTLETRKGELGPARTRFSQLIKLDYDDPLEKVHWQIVGAMRLAELETLAKAPSSAVAHWQQARQELDTLLELGHLNEFQEERHLSLRARTLMHLNQPRAALADVRRAAKLDQADTELFRGTLAASYLMGETDAAAELFDLATASQDTPPEVLLYFALWVDDLAKRSHKPQAANAARDFLKNYRTDAWGTRLARHALGQLSGGELRQAASSPGEVAEALFYEAMRLRTLGQEPAARPLLEEVLSTQMVSFFEYRVAQWLLAGDLAPTPVKSGLAQDYHAR